MKVVNSEQMKRIDARTTSAFGIPSIVLMENAARGCVSVIEKKFANAERIAIFCGPGQNGGDGFAIARHLHNRGRVVLVMLLGASRVAGDARTNLEICRQLDIPIVEVEDDATLDRALVRALECDLIIDAIFGTGLTRKAEGIFADAIEALSTLRIPVLAVDVPSGINASTGDVEPPVVRADCTVTFALPKIAHLFEPAASFCGELFVEEISIPHGAIDAENVALEILGRDVVWPLFPERAAESHKGTYGHLAIIGGSEGRRGAATLAARGALRIGAGLVTVITDRDTADLIHVASAESMTRSAQSADEMLAALEKKDALLIGPGLPDADESYARTRELVKRCTLPLVVDASGLNAFAGAAESLRGDTPRVITPHPGELARLVGGSAADINRDRLRSAQRAAAATRAIVVLKGHRTLIASPDGRVAINPTGNPAMATGGMGDVLGGAIAALLARGMEAFDAACAGAYVHGLAADILRDEVGDTGVLASDVANAIPRAIQKVRNG